MVIDELSTYIQIYAMLVITFLAFVGRILLIPEMCLIVENWKIVGNLKESFGESLLSLSTLPGYFEFGVHTD